MGGVFQGGDIVFGVRYDDPALARSMAGMQNTMAAGGNAIAAKFNSVGVGFTQIGSKIQSVLGSAVDASMSLGKGMANIATLGVTNLSELEGQIREVTVAYGMDLTSSVDAAYQAISAGAESAKVPYVLEEAAIAATAGMTDLKTSVELGMGVVNAFGTGVDDLGNVFDQAFVAVQQGVTTFEQLSAGAGQLSPIFSAAGLSSKEMFASIAALTLGGTQTSVAMTSMKAAIAGIVKPTAEATKMAEKLGIDFTTTGLKTKGLSAFMADLRQKTGGNIDTMAQLFGSVEGLQAMLSITGNQAEAFNKALDTMEQGTWGAKQAFDAFVEANPQYAWQLLNSRITDLKVTIGKFLVPILGELLETKIMPLVDGVGKWIKENEGLAKSLTIAGGSIGAFMIVAGPLLMFTSSMIYTLSGITAAIKGLIAGIGWLAGPTGWVLLKGAALTGAAATAAFGVAVAAATVAVIAIGYHTVKWLEALNGKKEATENAIKSEQRMIKTLQDQGVVVDYVTFASMSQADGMAYVKKAQEEARVATLKSTLASKGQIDVYYQVANHSIKMGISITQAMQQILNSTDESTRGCREALKRLSLDHRESPSINDLVAGSLDNYISIWKNRLDFLRGYIANAVAWMRRALGSLGNFGGFGGGNRPGAKLNTSGMAGKISPQANGVSSFSAPISSVSVSVNGASGDGNLIAREIAKELPRMLMKELKIRANQSGLVFGV